MGWLERYLEYTAKQESPELFHLWSAVAMLGHVLGRQVMLDMFYFKLYPGQTMVVLVSESAIAKKTTAAEIAIEFLDYLPPERVNRLPEKLSPPILVDSLDRLDAQGKRVVPTVGLIYAEEMGVFFTKESFAETLATMVNSISNAPKRFTYTTRGMGAVELQQPCVGLLGCTTPQGLANELPKTAQTAGFFGRLVIVYQNEIKEPNPLTEPPPEHGRLKGWLIKDLYRIAELRGNFRFSADGKEWYEEWYTRYTKWASTLKSSTETGYWNRRPSHLLRTAMVLAASHGNELVLTEGRLVAAHRLLEQIEEFLSQASKQLGVKPLSYDHDRIVAALEQFGPQTPGQVYRRVWRHFEGVGRFNDTWRSLVHAGLVAVSGTPPNQILGLVFERGQMLARVDTGEGPQEVMALDRNGADGYPRGDEST